MDLPEFLLVMDLPWPEDPSVLGSLALFAFVMLVATSLVSPKNPVMRLVVSGVILVLLLRYLAWRVFVTWPFGEEITLDVLWQWTFALVEAAALLGSALLWIYQSRTVDRSAEATRLAASMTSYPLVDVLIPTYNEAEEILERTIAGAKQIDYPRYRIWVLDDGRRESMRALARALGVGYLNRADNKHAKAGNMNAALERLLLLREPPDLVAILDADFVPTPQFLSRTAPFFQNPKVGLVQTPQHFFNPDPMQVNLRAEGVLPDDQRFAQGVDLPARDAWGAATSCGTSSVVRVASLKAIGGFPYESVCEDTLTSVKFWTLGQHTVFLNEPLTQGLAVEGIAELLTQRGRWSLGNMQILRSEWGLFSRHPMPLAGRAFLLSLLSGSIVAPIIRILVTAAPAIYLFTGSLAVPFDVHTLFAYLGPFILAHYIGILWVSKGACLPVITEAINTIEYFSTFKAGLVGLFKPLGHKFKVTAKGLDRDAAVVHWNLVGAFAVPIVLYVLGLALNLMERPLAIRDTESLTVVALWCYYNAAMLVVCIYMSIDLPRRRRLDTFRIDRPARLSVDDCKEWCTVVDLSPSSARIRCVGGIAPGDRVWLELADDLRVPARVTHFAGTSADLALDAQGETKRALMALLFSGAQLNSVEACSFSAAAARTLARTVR